MTNLNIGILRLSPAAIWGAYEQGNDRKEPKDYKLIMLYFQG